MAHHNLKRFVDAQRDTYEQALAEVKNGWKYTHWIWFVFPQLKGFGFTYNSRHYGIKDKEEAEAYLAHRTLGKRLREITSALLELKDKTAEEVFGKVDAMKVLSCMTLFNEVAKDDLFQQVIDRYYEGKPDEVTKKMLEQGSLKYRKTKR